MRQMAVCRRLGLVDEVVTVRLGGDLSVRYVLPIVI